MTMRLDIVTNDAGELVRREHARELGASVVVAIYRLAKLAQVHDLTNQAFLRQLEQTHQMIGEYCLRAGTNVSILFAHKAVFVAGQLLKGSRSTYEAASELGDIFDRLGGADLGIQRDVTREELRAFAEQISIGFRSAPGTFRSPTPKIRLRPVTDAARLRGLELEELTPEQRIVRTYASAVVIMRRFFEDLQASRYVLPRRIKRIAQSLVDLSEGSTPAFLGVTEVRNANFDEAGRAANTAILAVSMAREVTSDRATLSQIAMAAMMHDVARPRALALASAAGAAMPGMQGPSTLSEDQEDRLAAGSAAVLTALGRVNEPSITRTVLAFEALWLRRQTWLGPVYWGARAPTLHANMIAIARRYNDLLTPEPGLQPPTPDYAVAQLAEELKDPQDRLVLRMLVSALGLLPLGTVVQLSTGEIAEVVRGARSSADRPKVRVVMDARGGTLAQPLDIDLANDPRRTVTRVVSVDGWRKGLALKPDVPGTGDDGGYVSPSDAPPPMEAPPPMPAISPLSAAPMAIPVQGQRRSVPPPAIAAGRTEGWAELDAEPPPRRDSSSGISGEHNSSQSLPSMGSSPSAVAEAMGRMINDSLRPPAVTPRDNDRTMLQPQGGSSTSTPIEPTARGNLATTPLPHVLVYMLDHGLSGSVVFDGGGGADTIFFVRGVPAKVRLAVPFATLGEVLVDAGAIDQETAEQVARAAQAEGVLFGQYLVAAGVLDEGAIRWALEAQVLHRVAQLTNLPAEVTYAYFRDVDLLADWGGGEVAISSALSPILASVRNWMDRARVRATLNRIGKHPLVLHEDAELSLLALTDAERATLDAIGAEAMTLPVLTARGVADEEAVASLVYALAVTRQFAFKGQKKAPMAPRGLLHAKPASSLPGGGLGAVSSSAIPAASGSMQMAAAQPSTRAVSQSRPAMTVAQQVQQAATGSQGGGVPALSASGSAPAAKRAPAASSPNLAPRPIAPAARPAATGARPAPQIRPKGARPHGAPASAEVPTAKAGAGMTSRRATVQGLQPSVPPDARVASTPPARPSSHAPPPDDDEMKTIAFSPRDAGRLAAQLQSQASSRPSPLGLDGRPVAAARPSPALPSRASPALPSKARPSYDLPTPPDAEPFGDIEAPDEGAAEDAMSSFRQAEAALQRNDVGAALELATKAAATDPTQFDYVTLLAWVQALSGSPATTEQSIKTLTRVLIEDPSNERALFYRGKLFARTSRLQEALEDFSDLVAANPQHREGQSELRLVKARIG